MISKRGKMITTEQVESLKPNIADVQVSYKSLGTLQTHGNHDEATRKSSTAIYLHRLDKTDKI